MVVGDDDQNIYAFGGASVRYIRQFESDYTARRYALVENCRSTRHIIHCANRIIGRARERMKAGPRSASTTPAATTPTAASMKPSTRSPGGGAGARGAARSAAGSAGCARTAARPCAARAGAPGGGGQWGRFAVIARRWQDLEAMAALCRLRAIPVQMQRDSGQFSLHVTREGDALLSLLRGEHRRTGRRRVLVRPRLLSRWFRRRFHAPPEADRAPCRAALAQFIVDAESAVPGASWSSTTPSNLYDFGAIGKPSADARPNAPLVLMTRTAPRAGVRPC